jgi:hypothetical protein
MLTTVVFSKPVAFSRRRPAALIVPFDVAVEKRPKYAVSASKSCG